MSSRRHGGLPPKDRFVRHWILAASMAASVGLAWIRLGPAVVPAPDDAARPGAGVDWYLVARMPPVTAQRESGVETMRARYAQWLSALRREGFRPVRLSEAFYRLSRGQRLPPRSVVMVFEPGYRRTLDVVGPIFAGYGWPAVWLTNEDAMRRARREFVTFHAAAGMARSGWWDVGYAATSGGYRLESRGEAPLALGPDGRPWAGVDGTFALNRGASLSRLNALNVNADWTAPELLDRLRAELPVERRAWLSKAAIHHKDWGVLAASGEKGEPPPAALFDLEAPDSRRGSKVYWLGTRGVEHFRLSLRARQLLGELQLHLRSDEATGDEVQVSIDRGGISILQRHAGAARSYGTLRRRLRGAPPALDLAFVGRRLAVVEPGGKPWLSPPLEPPAGPGTLLELSVFEKARGLAIARGVSLAFEPAEETAPLWAGAR